MQGHKYKVVWGGLALVFGVSTQTAFGSFHLWQISEIFSSADGAIQFIELQTTADDQLQLNGVSLVSSNASGGVHKSTQLSGNLSGSSANKRLLIAT